MELYIGLFFLIGFGIIAIASYWEGVKKERNKNTADNAKIFKAQRDISLRPDSDASSILERMRNKDL